MHKYSLVGQILPNTDPEVIVSHVAQCQRGCMTYLRPKPNVKNFRSSLRRPLASSHLEGLKAPGSGYTSGSLAIALSGGQRETTAKGTKNVQMVPDNFSASRNDVVFLLARAIKSLFSMHTYDDVHTQTISFVARCAKPTKFRLERCQIVVDSSFAYLQKQQGAT